MEKGFWGTPRFGFGYFYFGYVYLCVKERISVFVWVRPCLFRVPLVRLWWLVSAGRPGFFLVACAWRGACCLPCLRCLGFVMSLSVSVCSRSSGFGSSVRLLSRLSVSGSVSVSVCPYTGVAFVSFEPLPALVPVWPAVRSLAWVDGSDLGDADDLFVAEIAIGRDNSRYFALEALLESVGL